MQDAHQTCPTCGQSLTYELDIDKGTVKILKVIAERIRTKGINAVHLSKELLGNGLTHHEVGNISRPRFHGLVAKVPGNASNYSLTTKGLAFLKGEAIPRVAIIKKATKGAPAHTLDHGEEMVTIGYFERGWGDYWSANGYEIREGRVITQAPVKTPQAQLL